MISPSDREDLEAPMGRCILCSRPFGRPGKGGFTVYKFDVSGVCTECVQIEKEKPGERYEKYLNDRKSSNR